jgi:hypothetical protein
MSLLHDVFGEKKIFQESSASKVTQLHSIWQQRSCTRMRHVYGGGEHRPNDCGLPSCNAVHVANPEGNWEFQTMSGHRSYPTSLNLTCNETYSWETIPTKETEEEPSQLKKKRGVSLCACSHVALQCNILCVSRPLSKIWETTKLPRTMGKSKAARKKHFTEKCNKVAHKN